MVLIWQGILIGITVLFLLIASYTDLRWREVPDWLNYGLIFSGLGLRFLFSFENGWGIFLNGLAGFLVCLGIAYLFYFTNQWGGGDSKLLMGMGAVVGLGFQDFSFRGFDFSLFLFFISLLVIGAFFGLFWCLGLVIKKRKSFSSEFRKIISSTKKWQILILFFSVCFLILSFFVAAIWPMVFFPIGGFYLLCFVRGTEKSCFVKETEVDKLVEGDWLAEDIFVDDRKIISKERGLEKDDVWQIRNLKQEGKLKTVLVKEGIPFVPSFLLSYVLIVFGKEIVGFVVSLV